MGRRHLSLAAAAAGAVVVSAAAAGTAVDWRTLATDPPTDAKLKALTAYVASDRASARAFSAELTYGDPAKLAQVDFRKQLVIAVFDGPTCKPHLPSVTSVAQHGRLLVLRLQGPAPSAANCHPRWPGGYELVTVPRSSLRSPYPMRAVARYS